MADTEHSVYLIGSKTICPVCSGMAVIHGCEELIRCIDCGEKFRIKGMGQTEREIICTQAG